MKTKRKPQQKQKTPRPQPLPPPSPSILERKFSDTRLIEFPDVRGKVVEKIEISTGREYHGITIYFRDKSLLTLNLETCFLLQPSLCVISNGEIKVVEEWPPIRSSTELC
jgi:hypothetical protein